jgi:DNA-binding CsgD family transcriptional regulator
MSPLVILVVLATALLTGPTAFLLLWLTYVKTGERTVRTLAFALLGLCFILLGNAASFILENFFGLHDGRVSFVFMNGVFLATIMTSAYTLRFIFEATEKPIASIHRTLFWMYTVLFFFLVISLPIFLVSGYAVDVRRGYLASTVYGTIGQAYATVLLVARRRRLPDIYRRALPSIFIVFLVIGILSVMNDVFGFGHILGGPDFPFSPVFFILLNISAVGFCLKALLHPGYPKLPAKPIQDFGFTEREREIVPLLIDGLSNDDIAEKLFISPHTVKNHVTSIFRKAEVESRFELLKKTTRQG